MRLNIIFVIDHGTTLAIDSRTTDNSKLSKARAQYCILGRAGVGKSTTVQKIKSALEVEGEKFEIVCSTGIACKSYGGIAKTVHSHYGLRVAELPSSLLPIERSVGQSDIVKQVADTTVLIWDEMSMSSSRIFELVNSIHHLIAQNDFAFRVFKSSSWEIFDN